MKHILVALLIISNSAFSQDSIATFWKNRCEFKTDGTGKSLGLKIKLSIPCTWKQADGERPHVVKKFIYNSGLNLANANLTINRMPATPSKAEIDEMFTENGLKELCEDYAIFISGKKLKIDGLDCGELTFKMTREHPIGTLYLYSLQYHFIHKDKMIVLSYVVGSTTADKAKESFDKYKLLFKTLAGSTVFISKWE